MTASLSGGFNVSFGAPLAITSDFFGMTLNGFTESGLVWPAWTPSTFRILDQFSSANPTLFVPDWNSTEPSNGSFTWTQWDAVWAKYIANGVTNLLVGFQGIPTWAKPGGVFNISAVTAFVTAYLTRTALDGLSAKYVEGVNEPNNGGAFFSGTITDLVNIQQAIYNAAKAFDPTITVLSPPVNSLGASAITYLQSFLSGGGGAYCDVIGFHAYPATGLGSPPEDLVANIASLKSMLAGQGQSGKPIWITEYDAGSGGSAAQNATFGSITCLLAWSLGLARQYWYSYDNGSGFGQLWTSGGGLNAAGVAWQQMTKWMTGAWMTQPAQLAGVVYTMGLARNGYQALAVWTTDGSTPSFSTPVWATQYHDIAGNKTTGLGATVTLGRNPILLESSNVF